jgi:dihydropteroate synthase
MEAAQKLTAPMIQQISRQIQEIDDKLSNRHIYLDPAGYFLISVDREQGLLVVRHFGMTVNDQGLAVDPDTGKPLSACGPVSTPLLGTYTAYTAKQMCVQLLESQGQPVVTQISHAAYLGRELMRAQQALTAGGEYIQD